jgi:hypothetical protein
MTTSGTERVNNTQVFVVGGQVKHSVLVAYDFSADYVASLANIVHALDVTRTNIRNMNKPREKPAHYSVAHLKDAHSSLLILYF